MSLKCPENHAEDGLAGLGHVYCHLSERQRRARRSSVLGPSCTFLGRAAALPFSRLSTPPLFISYLARCEVLPSCDRNVPGGTGGEGLTLTCPGETLAHPGGAVPSALLTSLDSPGISIEIESRGRELPFWGRGEDMCRSLERVSESIRHDFGFRGGR